MLKKIVKIRPLSSEKVTHIKTYTEMYIYTHTCTHSCRAIFALVYANCIVYRTRKHTYIHMNPIMYTKSVNNSGSSRAHLCA